MWCCGILPPPLETPGGAGVQADLFAKDTEGNTFLHCLLQPYTTITSQQSDDIVSFLVTKGHAKLFNVQNNFKATPFQLGVRYLAEDSSKATLALLHDNGVDFNNENIHGSRPLNYAVTRGRGRKVLSNMIHFGASYTYHTKFGYNLLHVAATISNLAAVQLLIEKGLDVNGITRDGDGQGRFTPLHLVIGSHAGGVRHFDRRLDVAKYLVEKGASLKIRSGSGSTAYEMAISSPALPDRDEILKLLKF